MNAYVLLLCCLTANLAHGTLTAAGAAATMSPSVPEWTAAAGATGKTVYSLSMQGWGGPPGLKKFQLSCTGGIITAQAHLALPKPVWPDPSRALQAIFFERFARSVPQFLTGVAPVLPWPTRRFERDARLTPQILKGMAKLAASLC
jgi:hypothetical protein